MTSVLVVVDLQVGVVRDAWDADGVLARTVALVERARAEGTPVVWVQDEQDFPRGSDDWQLAPVLEPHDDEERILKAYRDAFAGTDLADVLAELRATRLVIAGAQSDFCVRTLGQSAAALGFDVTLVGDCHTTWGGEHAGAPVTGEQIVAQVNAYFVGLRYPGQTFTVEGHGTVPLA
ncbi:isochorismatase [Cellulomonas chitinilytica]|uniref:Isochorismatase n=1 Tax=Cellulomonas chitinilytica TaxID=398759 RepID=A0A919P6R0_9CELL|nr:isochorismatase [Cellulomonas chitinilytica]